MVRGAAGEAWGSPIGTIISAHARANFATGDHARDRLEIPLIQLWKGSAKVNRRLAKSAASAGIV
jgi:hypothetical protein